MYCDDDGALCWWLLHSITRFPITVGLFVNSEQTEHCSKIRRKKQNIKHNS